MNRNKESKSKEKIYLEQTCKVLTSIFVILVLVLSFIILKDSADENKAEEKEVLVSELNVINKEVV